jgi:Biopolymer transport protein ExbD/TolR
MPGANRRVTRKARISRDRCPTVQRQWVGGARRKRMCRRSHADAEPSRGRPSGASTNAACPPDHQCLAVEHRVDSDGRADRHINGAVPGGIECRSARDTGASLDDYTRQVVVEITADRAITLNSAAVTLPQLEGRLKQLFASRRDRSVFVIGAASLRYGDVVPLIDAAHGAGADRVASSRSACSRSVVLVGATVQISSLRPQAGTALVPSQVMVRP